MNFAIDPVAGLVNPAHFCPSPNCDERPQSIAIDMIVVHGISLPPGQYGNDAIEDFFCNKLDYSAHPFFKTIAHLRVSAHLLIKRTGAITQFVPFTKRAWHAGESCFKDQIACNDFSIGIELEGSDDVPYEPLQYQRLNDMIKLLMQAYPTIRYDRIVRHADIAPGRKTDPGPAFNWAYLMELLA